MNLKPFRPIELCEPYFDYEIEVPKHGIIKLTVEKAIKNEALLKVETKDGAQATVIAKIHPQST